MCATGGHGERVKCLESSQTMQLLIQFLVAGLSLMHTDKLAELCVCCSTATSILTGSKNRKNKKELLCGFKLVAFVQASPNRR